MALVFQHINTLYSGLTAPSDIQGLLEHPEPTIQSRRLHHYLQYFSTLNLEARHALKEIYTLSQNPEQGSSHVILAMIEASKHPALARLVRENVVLRAARRLASNQGQEDKACQLEAILEDFHTALDAFIHEQPLDMAHQNRQLRKQPHQKGEIQTVCTGTNRVPWVMSETELLILGQFKKRIQPLLEKLKLTPAKQKHQEA